jgi:hypothetical protein
MELKEHNQATESPDISPLAKDKTHGEKVYDLVFNKALNFWINLFTSAAFSLWAAHSTHKVPFMREGTTPRVVQQKLADALEKSWMMRFIKDDATRQDRAFARAETLTLVTPGHFIMIPSVWLGAKIKPAFVRYFDRKYYGDEAMDDPSLAYRHQLIDAEAKPTLLGATVGRIGTVAATQVTAALIGTDNNLVNKAGKALGIKGIAESKGLNQYAGKIGDTVGDGIRNMAPGTIDKLNNKLSRGLDWSEAQRKSTRDTSGVYNRGVQNFVKYTALDTLYTMVTAGSIHPIMKMIRNLPGMTYHTRPPVPKTIIHDDGGVTKVRVPTNTLVDAVNDNPHARAANDDDTVPTTLTSGAQLHDRVAAAPVLAKAGA